MHCIDCRESCWLQNLPQGYCHQHHQDFIWINCNERHTYNDRQLLIEALQHHFMVLPFPADTPTSYATGGNPGLVVKPNNKMSWSFASQQRTCLASFVLKDISMCECATLLTGYTDQPTSYIATDCHQWINEEYILQSNTSCETKDGNGQLRKGATMKRMEPTRPSTGMDRKAFVCLLASLAVTQAHVALTFPPAR